MKSSVFKTLAVFMLILVMLAFVAPGADAAYSVKQVFLRFQGTAGEALVTGQAVCLKDSDGYIYKADADVSALRPAIGVVGSKSASAAGQSVEVVVVGILSGWSSLAENGSGYLSETAGAITQSAPSYSQIMGFAISTTSYLINCRSYFDTSAITSLGVLSGATPIILEGATPDAYEMTLAPADPKSDVTLTFPQYTGDVPIVVGQDCVQYSQAGTGTADGASFTIPANTLTTGKALRIKAAGTLTGGNAAPTVHLYIADAQIITLLFPAVTAGDWVAEFLIAEHTDDAHQKVYGRVDTAAGAGGKCDYAADTTDTTSAFTVKLQIQAANAGDTITEEMCILEFLP